MDFEPIFWAFHPSNGVIGSCPNKARKSGKLRVIRNADIAADLRPRQIEPGKIDLEVAVSAILPDNTVLGPCPGQLRIEAARSIRGTDIRLALGGLIT